MVMSPSVWWDNFAIYRLVDSIEQKPPVKIWLDTGTAEPGWEQTRELCKRLVEKGWEPGKESNTWKPTMAITAKQPGQRGSNRRYAFCFQWGNKTVAASLWEA